jgi:MoxR-like ATPase
MEQTDSKELIEKIQRESAFIDVLLLEVKKVIIGQKGMVERLLVGLLADGHLLLEGVPGLAKTLAIKTLSEAIDAKFSRIQFTPDLLPADLIGTQIYSVKDDSFTTRKGPVFANFILADEINRAPAKVQSALLEAMQEHQVTIGEKTFHLESPFLVLATQNPIEQEGTYPLPEAQMDRFFIRVAIGYPSVEEEMDILERYTGVTSPMQSLEPVASAQEVLEMQAAVGEIYCAREVRSYVAAIAAATRRHPMLQLGCSTRGAIALVRAAQACALLAGRNYIIPEDVQRIALPVLAHRVSLSPEAKMKGLGEERILSGLIASVQVPVRVP